MRRFLSTATRSLVTLAAVTGALQAQQNGKPLPLKYVGPPTVANITAGDLMTRLYKYADDSMMGRDVGSEYHLKAVAYIESELRKLGLKPGGTGDSFYQDFPIWSTGIDPTSTLTIAGKTYPLGRAFLALPGGRFPTTPLQAIFAGNPWDTLTVLDSATVAGKILVTSIFPIDTAAQRIITASAPYQRNLRARRAATISIAVQPGDSLQTAFVTTFTRPSSSMTEPRAATAAGTILVPTTVGDQIFGAPLASTKRGEVSGPVTVSVRMNSTLGPPGRNVIAILPGSDPVLKNQYVAIGAHSDHVGFTPLTVMREHDSLAVFNKYGRPAGAEGGRNLVTSPITPEEWTRINAEIAELRKVYPPRPDSITNGADDDGSGSVSLLELAEMFAKGGVKPKRSILFVWQAGEERGMWGSGYFMDNPTVPRDSIVAQLNIDMVGRGAASDITGQAKSASPAEPGAVLHGGDRYLQLVGSRRLSTELGDLVEKVNTEKKHGFTFDYNIDADGHQQNIYCRSDHWSYAKWGVPVVFFTTGGHADYHQVTDEPQYIRYDHMALVGKLIFDIAMATADLPHRPLVDKAKPNPAPATACRQ